MPDAVHSPCTWTSSTDRPQTPALLVVRLPHYPLALIIAHPLTLNSWDRPFQTHPCTFLPLWAMHPTRQPPMGLPLLPPPPLSLMGLCSPTHCPCTQCNHHNKDSLPLPSTSQLCVMAMAAAATVTAVATTTAPPCSSAGDQMVNGGRQGWRVATVGSANSRKCLCRCGAFCPALYLVFNNILLLIILPKCLLPAIYLSVSQKKQKMIWKYPYLWFGSWF